MKPKNVILCSPDARFIEETADRAQIFKQGIPFNSHHSHIVDYPLHKHDYLELDFFINGEGINIIDGIEFEIQGLTSCLHFPYTYHEIHAKRGSELEVINFTFSETFISQKVVNLLYQVGCGVQVAVPDNCRDIILNDCDYLNRLYAGGDFILRTDLITARLEALAITTVSLIDQKMQCADKKEMVDFSRITNVLTFIMRNYMRHITVTELAAKAFVSPGYFNEFFRKNYGISHKAYINELRMKRAGELFQRGDMSLSRIVAECGFSSITNFKNAFERYHGYSIAEYTLTINEKKRDYNGKE